MGESMPVPEKKYVDVEGYPPVPLCKLCSRCQSVFSVQPAFSLISREPIEYWSSPRRHHQNEAALRDAASDGCVLCHLILVESVSKGIWNASKANGICYEVRFSDHATHIDLWFYAGDTEGRTYLVSIYLDPLKGWIPPFDTGTSTGNKPSNTTQTPSSVPLENTGTTLESARQETLQMTNYWLQNCEQQHSICRHPVPGAETLPSRLLQVWKSRDTLQHQARLVSLSPQGTSPVRFATLSHRWGPNPTLRLLESNMTDLCAEIPVLTLDKVFQDAIEVTCNLGLAYLWVDSLCIIQDSSSDWAAESVKMGAIYKNAVCNIAAANIISDDAGTESVLFSREQRPSFHHFSPHVCISWRSEDTLNDSQEHRDKTMAIEVGGYYTIRDPMQWLTTVDKTPLNRRGWISQERELSPCILHFDSQQLYWRCSELLACESYPNGIPYMDRSHKYCTTRSFRDLVEEQATASVAAVAAATVTEARESVLRFWGDFVERYSATELTYKSDKLPAAFGMACELERLMPQNRFLAGLWESHLAEGLLWSVVREEDPGMVGPTDILIPDHYRVPTWSWASLHHPVVYLKEPTTPFHLVSSIFEDGLTTDQNQPDDDTNSPFVVCNRLRITTSRPLMALADALERSAYVDKSNTTKNPFYLFPDIWGPTIEIPKSAAELPPPSQANTASPSDDAAAEQRKLSTRTLILPILEEPLGYTAVGLLVNEIIPDGNISGGLGGDVEMFSRIGTFRAYYHDEAQLRTVFPDAAADGDGEDEGDGVDQAQAASRDYTGKTCIYLV